MELEETVETSKHMAFNNPPAALAFALAFGLAAAGAALVLVLAPFLLLSLVSDPLDPEDKSLEVTGAADLSSPCMNIHLSPFLHVPVRSNLQRGTCQ